MRQIKAATNSKTRMVTPIRPSPSSCDTFVVLPPATAGGCIIFGKNSDRPDDEVQEVVAFPAARHPPGASLQCTYISIPQATRTHAVMLSKPAWMWGAEMAANDAGLVIGNEAVWTLEPEGEEALLGMDLVRLAAERCSTAEAAVDTIAGLLEAHGQGGGCEEGGSWSYHNSFLIADRAEAWVLETAGRWWAAEKVTTPFRNISNCLSIRTTIHKHSAGLLQYAKECKRWDGTGDFDWASAFSSGPVPSVGQKSGGREAAGYRLLQQATSSSGCADAAPACGFRAEDMMAVLRDCPSGICMTGGGFRTNCAQVSVLQPPGSNTHTSDLHWFTGTPDPSKSAFKPCCFPQNVEDDNWAQQMSARAAELWKIADKVQGQRLSQRMKVSLAVGLKDIESEGMQQRSPSPVTYAALVQRELKLLNSVL